MQIRPHASNFFMASVLAMLARRARRRHPHRFTD
jgi:hypothetical protein